MKHIVKQLYRLKIRLMFYFNLGWSELATPIAVLRDIGLTLTFLDVLFKINFGWRIDALICVFGFVFFLAFGILLKKTGMSDYTNRLNNSINPELKLINDIAKKLNVYAENEEEATKTIK